MKKDSTKPTTADSGQNSPDDEAKVKRTKKGTFAKGSARPEGAGRKPGTPNRTTQQLRNYFGYLLDREIDEKRIEKALEDLFLDNPKLYLDAIIKLAPFYVPTLQSVELTGDVTVDDPFRAHMRNIAQLSQNIDNKK